MDVVLWVGEVLRERGREEGKPKHGESRERKEKLYPNGEMAGG